MSDRIKKIDLIAIGAKIVKQFNETIRNTEYDDDDDNNFDNIKNIFDIHMQTRTPNLLSNLKICKKIDILYLS